ncbi:DNA recombination protein RmuC [Sideroxydans sp. CL21]|uniref:DNA recombination protein RmuC n=1 Tax=Sideroxydans sp. CL21 TaxID=2600596 RepID=UPI0024BBF08E|nr:DNA recombination protein RmuC [Sideroxydans sp. CL21]
MTLEILLIVAVLVLLVVLLAMQFKQPARAARMLEQQHRAMLGDLHDGLNKQGDRLIAAQAAESERLRAAVGEELRTTRDAVNALQAKQDLLRSEMLAQTLAKLAEQGRADQELIQNSFRNATQHLATSIETLSKTVDARLEQIGGKVNERLDEGFKKTNETFVSVMARLATIDEAQKKIDGLTTNVVSLQELLGDKRSRGAFGEVQLEGLVRNILAPQAYEMQYTLPNGSRADCVLKLPEPTGMVAVDSKFPLENYHRMFDAASPAEKLVAERQFKADVKKHVEDIASKYIIPNVTSDGAVMFIPAEAVFAEIHAHHSDVVDYAMQRRVWIVSPTTLMAVLNTARAVMKDVETRKQVHIIKDELGKLGKEFGRFDERMKKLADHIRQAHEDAQDVHTTSQKISKRFISIEQVELEHTASLSKGITEIDR